MTEQSLDEIREEIGKVLSDPNLAGQHTTRMTMVCAALCEAFAVRGMDATMVGGGAVEFHAPGAYTSEDTDLVIESREGGRPNREAIGGVFEDLGFEKGTARHWIRDDFFVEVADTFLEGEAEEYDVGAYELRVNKKEYLFVERLVSYEQSGHTGSALQAIAMVEAFGDQFDTDLLSGLLQRERQEDTYRLVKQLAEQGVEITHERLRKARASLRTD